VALSALAMPLPVLGRSVYPQKPDDPGAVVLTKVAFPELHADGIADDTATIQRAIDQASTKSMVLLVPEGRYRVSQTIGIPPSTRLIGFGNNRPTIVLGAHTAGYDNSPPKYMVWFSGGGSGSTQNAAPHGGSVGAGFPDASPGTFYSGLSNIDFEIQDGNPAAVAIRAHFAQHGIITHVDFHIGSGYAAMDQIGNEAEDLHFFGGDYGVVTGGTSPSWQYTLLDSSFDGQRVAAIKTHNTGLTLLRDQFSNMPTVIAIDEDHPERLYMKDCRFSNITGPAVIIGDEENVRTQINLQDIVCQKAPVVAAYLKSKKQVAGGAAEVYCIKQFTYGLQAGDDIEAPAIKETSEIIVEIPPPVSTDIPPLPPMETWVSVREFGAVGDGKTDDGPAFAAAIAKSKTIFIPGGRYRVTDTIQLKPDTVLVGLNPITTQIAIDDAAENFIGGGELKAIIDAPPGTTNIVQGISIDTGGNNPRAVGVKWRAGETSMVNDVKFLGGHGTSIPGARRHSPYNRDHTGDSDPARKWSSCGPSLWVTDNGGGTFANIWTASTFASAGMVIDNTITSGRIYELSSEHHVRNEIIMRGVSNWNIYAQQTEEEWGESPACLPLLIDNCSNLTFANTILFRVFAMAAPYPTGISISNSRDVRFFGIRTYGQSPYNFDKPVVDATTGFSVPDREIALVYISGKATKSAANPSLEKIADGFFSADHAVIDSAGNAYFVDLHENKVYQFSADTQKVTVLRDDAIKPFALAVDRSDNLIILSRLGKAYAVSLKDPHGLLRELSPLPAAPRPGLIAFLPADRWWDSGQFIETNARREPLDFISPDGSMFIPVPADYHTGQQHNWTGQPIDLYRGNQLAAATPGKPFYVADENEHKTWIFTPTNEGTLKEPRLFAQHGEAGVTTDPAGNVYIAEGNIYVYNADGKLIDRIQTPERPLSMVFCGKDRRTLFITGRHAVYAMKLQSFR
jgi:sugar lactone lactonase YvrE/pectin methylesterase-like acyl-CoA thioesterase